MAEYPIQVSSSINGDRWEVSGADAEDLFENLKGLAEGAGPIHEKLTVFKQAGIANGVFTGTAGPATPEPERGAGSPPPTSGPPNCEGGHGPMKDFGDGANRKKNKRGEPYRNRYYCSQFGSDCKPRD